MLSQIHRVRYVFAFVVLAGGLFALRCGSLVFADAEETVVEAKSRPADPKEALAELNLLIGQWRGVGMPRRGSRAGAWIESAEWVWDFSKETPAIRYDVKKGKLVDTARLSWDSAKKEFTLKLTTPEETTREYRGQINDADKLVLESKADEADESHRITITGLNEKRTLVLHEKRKGTGLFRRVAEVGYTRAGTSLAIEGAGQLECIVTGGKGTIPVTFKGQTYYVCCTGCKQAFDDDPAGVVAAYQKKVAERKTKQKQ